MLELKCHFKNWLFIFKKNCIVSSLNDALTKVRSKIYCFKGFYNIYFQYFNKNKLLEMGCFKTYTGF